MLSEPQRQTIVELHAKGLSVRQISRTLGHARPTVRQVLAQGTVRPPSNRRPVPSMPELTSQLPALYCEARGNVVRMLQYFDTHEGLSKKTKVVVNRMGLEDSQISLTKALETIGREVAWQVPNDYATMVEARNNGVPLVTQAPRAKITKSLEGLAGTIDGSILTSKPESEEKKGRKGKGY